MVNIWGGLHGSDVELHVGGVDLQELKQQGLSNLVGSDRGIIMMWSFMLSLGYMINWEPFG